MTRTRFKDKGGEAGEISKGNVRRKERKTEKELVECEKGWRKC